MSKRNLIAVGILGSAPVGRAPCSPKGTAAGAGGGGHGGGGHAGGGHAAVGHVGGGTHVCAGGTFRWRSACVQRRNAQLQRRLCAQLRRRLWWGIPRVDLCGASGRLGGYRGGWGGYHGGWGGYHGYSTGAYWGGGYWHGGYWPRAYYGLGYAWFLPVLPLAYATYWYGGIPYYYANDAYYQWSPDYGGYVATDPPPVADPSGAGAAAAPDASGGGAPMAGAGAPGAGAPMAGAGAPGAGAPDPAQSGQIYMYPKNGQSEEQQRTDKLECQKWASDQVGLGSNGPDYRRAMVACVEGRGYSAN